MTLFMLKNLEWQHFLLWRWNR